MSPLLLVALAQARILIETHQGGFPDERPAWVAQLSEAAAPADPDAVETALSRPAGPEPTEQETALILEALDAHHTVYVNGDWESAARRIDALIQRLESMPAACARDARLARALARARLLLGDCHRRLDRPSEAAGALAPLVRADPAWEPPASEWAPSVVRFFADVRGDLARQGKASLEVETDPAGLPVFVEGRQVGAGPARVKGLAPGRYRVMARDGERFSRAHEVRVERDERLTIDLGFDLALRTRPAVGLVFAGEAERNQHELAWAARVARGVGAPQAIVAGEGDYRGRRSLIGSLLDAASGRAVRTGIVALEPPPARATIAALGRFLAFGESAPGVLVPGGEIAAAPAAATSPVPRAEAEAASAGRAAISPAWKWLAAAGAVAALAAGAALIAIDGGCADRYPGTGNCRSVRDSAVPGWAAIGAGAALSGATVYLFVGELP